MGNRQRRYSKEELAKRGQVLCEAEIEQQLGSSAEGKTVAVDIEAIAGGTFLVEALHP